MRLVLMLLTVGFSAFVETAFAKDRSSPLEPIQGYELRLLDKKLPVEISTKEKSETKEMPVWIFIPTKETPDRIDLIDEITEPDDLSIGTALLPPPPSGFGLRALKLPLRAATQLDSGRSLIVEVPVFIYYRQLPPPVARSEPRVVEAPETPAAQTQSHGDAAAENRALRSQLAALQREFTALVAIMPDGTAKEQLKVLVQRMPSPGSDTSVASAHSGDSNIN